MACGVFHLHSVVLNTGHGAVIAERSAPGVLSGISLSVCRLAPQVVGASSVWFVAGHAAPCPLQLARRANSPSEGFRSA